MDASEWMFVVCGGSAQVGKFLDWFQKERYGGDVLNHRLVFGHILDHRLRDHMPDGNRTRMVVWHNEDDRILEEIDVGFWNEEIDKLMSQTEENFGIRCAYARIEEKSGEEDIRQSLEGDDYLIIRHCRSIIGVQSGVDLSFDRPAIRMWEKDIREMSDAQLKLLEDLMTYEKLSRKLREMGEIDYEEDDDAD